MRMTDSEAMRRVKKGEIDCFSHLVRQYTGRIHSFIAGQLFNRDEADDLVQNVFFSFYKAIGRFDESRPVLPYLFEIARNELKMFYRSHKKTVPLAAAAKVAVEEDKEGMTVEEAETALAGLKIDQRRALRLAGQGYSYREIAGRLKKPVNTVRTIIRRGRLSLINQMKYGKT